MYIIHVLSSINIYHICISCESIIILTVVTVSWSSIWAVAVTTSVIVAWIWATIICGKGIAQQNCKYNQKLHVRSDESINAYGYRSFNGSLYTFLGWIVDVWLELMVAISVCLLSKAETHG